MIFQETDIQEFALFQEGILAFAPIANVAPLIARYAQPHLCFPEASTGQQIRIFRLQDAVCLMNLRVIIIPPVKISPPSALHGLRLLSISGLF